MNTLIVFNLNPSKLTKYCKIINSLSHEKLISVCSINHTRNFSIEKRGSILLNNNFPKADYGSLIVKNDFKNKINSIFIRFQSIDGNKSDQQDTNIKTDKSDNPQPVKKPSKFKQFYSQYGPIFVVVHLITVVLWIYGFFLISKQLVKIICSFLFYLLKVFLLKKTEDTT